MSLWSETRHLFRFSGPVAAETPNLTADAAAAAAAAAAAGAAPFPLAIDWNNRVKEGSPLEIVYFIVSAGHPSPSPPCHLTFSRTPRHPPFSKRRFPLSVYFHSTSPFWFAIRTEERTVQRNINGFVILGWISRIKK